MPRAHSKDSVVSRGERWSWATVGLGMHMVATAIFVLGPLAVLVAYSFSGARYATVWGGFSTKWYARLVENVELRDALVLTLKLAGVSTLIATVLGTAAALGHWRLTGRSGRAVQSFFYLPVMVPEIVLGLALLIFFTKVWVVERGLWTMTAGHVVFCLCYVFAVVSTRLRGFDGRLMEAARDLGANGWQAFWWIQFPLIRPGVLGGALLSLAISLDEFVVAYFVTGAGVSTLPVEIFTMMKKGVTPEINALATLLLLASVLLALASVFVLRRPR
ncbi:MAG: ABC transporter permease [Verrucomicrobiales bacterium]